MNEPMPSVGYLSHEGTHRVCKSEIQSENEIARREKRASVEHRASNREQSLNKKVTDGTREHQSIAIIASGQGAFDVVHAILKQLQFGQHLLIVDGREWFNVPSR